MSKLLQKFTSSIPKVQAKQILGILNGLRDAGTIGTLQEFNSKLTELTAVLRGTNPQPLSKLLPGIVGEFVSSDQWNASSKWAQLDLETAFAEAQAITDALAAHQSIFRITMLENIDKAIRDLEKTIELYEFYNQDTYGFADAQYNTFDSLDDSGLESSDPIADTVYVDLRHNSLPADCKIDVLSQNLLPGLDSSESLDISSASVVVDAETKISWRTIEPEEAGVENLIDGTTSTSWLRPILTTELVSGGVRTKVKLDLDSVRDCNCIELEPACSMPMVLESFTYKDQDNEDIVVELDETITKGKAIHFSRVATNSITLTLLQLNPIEVHYHYDKQSGYWAVTSGNNVEKVMSELYEVLQEQTIREILGLEESLGLVEVTGYQYDFGLDNVRLLLSEFASESIYVSKPLTIDRVGLMGLITEAEIPTSVSLPGTPPNWSIEYTILKRDFNTEGTFIGHEFLPILPIGAGLEVEHERLFPDYDGVAFFRFCPDSVATTPILYRDLSTAMDIGTDFTVRVGDGGEWRSNWVDVETDITALPAASVPATVYIQIDENLTHVVYTASYMASVAMSNSTDSPARKIGDYVRIQFDGTLRGDRARSETAAYSELYLHIVFRNNSLTEIHTPAKLGSYKLLASSYDEGKFVE